MGNSYPHFNITSLSYIVCCTPSDLMKIITIYKNKLQEEGEAGGGGGGSDENLKITKEKFNEILILSNIHESGHPPIPNSLLSTLSILESLLLLFVF